MVTFLQLSYGGFEVSDSLSMLILIEIFIELCFFHLHFEFISLNDQFLLFKEGIFRLCLCLHKFGLGLGQLFFEESHHIIHFG